MKILLMMILIIAVGMMGLSYAEPNDTPEAPIELVADWKGGECENTPGCTPPEPYPEPEEIDYKTMLDYRVANAMPGTKTGPDSNGNCWICNRNGSRCVQTMCP